jgi:hypothetical protein
MHSNTRPQLLHSRVNSHLIFAPELPVNYVLNAKGGCSTILTHLWKILDDIRGSASFNGDPHAAWPWGRISDCSVREISHVSVRRTFTMVRNPFARALSAYLSKIGQRKDSDLFVWNIFRERFALAADARPSFDDYLEMIEREPVEMMDIHWAPQVRNLMQPAARIDDIFYLESIEELHVFLEQWSNMPVARSDVGKRDAVDKMAHYYTPRAIERVRRIYADDFDIFGYEPDYREQASQRPIRQMAGSPGGIGPLLKYMAAENWDEKLSFLDKHEALSGSDFSTAMARFCCGGPEEGRVRAVETIMAECPRNWLLLREVAMSLEAHGEKARSEVIMTLSRGAHDAIVAGSAD